jgi:hypothetical protein
LKQDVRCEQRQRRHNQPPGQHCQGIWVRVQQQVRIGLVPKARNGGAVKGDALGKGSGQLPRQDGDILLPAKYIAEGQPDKLNILFLYILQNLVLRIFHGRRSFQFITYICR